MKSEQEPWYEENIYGEYKNPNTFVMVAIYIFMFDLLVIITF